MLEALERVVLEVLEMIVLGVGRIMMEVLETTVMMEA